MNRKDIYSRLALQCSQDRAIIEVPTLLVPRIMEKLVATGAIPAFNLKELEEAARASNAFDLFGDYCLVGGVYDPVLAESCEEKQRIDCRKVGQASEVIKHSLLSDFTIHELLHEYLMLMAQTHGWWHYWDIDGVLISSKPGYQPKRAAYRIKEDREIWFQALCGYNQLPIFPLEWLEKRIYRPYPVDVSKSMLDRLGSGTELWTYRMSPEARGPLCDEAGFALVRDGIPIAKDVLFRS